MSLFFCTSIESLLSFTSCDILDGLMMTASGKSSETFGTRGFFDACDACSILSRSCSIGAGDCELALKCSGTGGGLGFFVGFGMSSCETKSFVLMTSAEMRFSFVLFLGRDSALCLFYYLAIIFCLSMSFGCLMRRTYSVELFVVVVCAFVFASARVREWCCSLRSSNSFSSSVGCLLLIVDALDALVLGLDFLLLLR